jgi:hypothetical protein
MEIYQWREPPNPGQVAKTILGRKLLERSRSLAQNDPLITETDKVVYRRGDISENYLQIVNSLRAMNNNQELVKKEKGTVIKRVAMILKSLPSLKVQISESAERVALEEYTDYEKPRLPEEGEEPNLITSLAEGEQPGPGSIHYPCIDIDYGAKLVPTQTPGHYHLYLNLPVTWEDYVELLEVLEKCKFIEPGYVAGSKARGYTTVRPPLDWVNEKIVQSMSEGMSFEEADRLHNIGEQVIVGDDVMYRHVLIRAQENRQEPQQEHQQENQQEHQEEKKEN